VFHSSAISDRYEHSLEAIVPFLQVYLKEFELIPIVLGPSDIRQMADIVDPLVDHDTLVVVSSDLSHFLPYDVAKTRDRQTLEFILDQKPTRLINREKSACGKIPILVLLELARRRQWDAVLLHYSNSGDTAGDKDQVVGYAAVAFFETAKPAGSTSVNHHIFSDIEGQVLVKLARLAIRERLGVNVDTAALDRDLTNPCFQKRRGTFVTLKKDARLRGCIGNLTAQSTIKESITRNAIKAAFHDPRFPPLTPEELNHIHISVSILTQPQPLKYHQSTDLLAKLRVHQDGVIIRKKTANATFLPQVWEQLPTPEKFLTHLCLKAGLPADAWHKSRLEVWTYQVQYFEEKE
jgi:AmmeMemoRadiSam system protein A